MRTLTCLFVFAIFSVVNAAESVELGPNDWPAWRGPQGTGVADEHQSPPIQWSDSKHVVWKTPIAGRGHSSPTVVGSKVYLATADEEKEVQSVLCFDRKDGKPLWSTEVHSGNFDHKGNKKSSHASSTVACDGQRLYINFLNHDSIYTTALDLDGKQSWQTKVGAFVNHQGFGSSPYLFDHLVIVSADHKGGGNLVALDRATGKIVWEVKRPSKANYASPIVYKLAGREQLLVQGCDLVSSFEPRTGKKLWEVPGSTTECVTNVVTDGKNVFVSGGYPKNHVQAIAADGSGKSVWENGARVYVPSMIVRDGYLYATLDGGVAMCWKSETGEEMWKERLGGTFSSSLVLVGDNLYATNEGGETFIFKADRTKYQFVAKNKLGDEVFATPSVCGGRIYHRVAEVKDGKRQEMLYCLGE